MTSRFIFAIAIGTGPVVSIGACGSDDTTVGAQDDAATKDVATDPSTADDAALEADGNDGSKLDAGGDGRPLRGPNNPNRCGGYETLELGGVVANPGDSCGACSDGTIACVGSNTVACEGASAPPCPTPPVDAGPNACGGYGPLTFLSHSASIGDTCGECGQIECGSTTSLVCTGLGPYCTTDAGLQSTCTIPSAAYTATPPSPTLPAETRPATTSISGIALPGNDLVFNPYDGFLYASIANYVSAGNSIARIDPMSAAVLQTMYVGPNPTSIALSDDGNALWVVVGGNGPASIRRVDLTTFTAGASFALPPNTSVSAIKVIAGTEDSVAVSSYESTPAYAYSIVVYDNGVPRPYGLRPQQQLTRLVGTPSASLLFANIASGYPTSSVNSVCVNANGVFLEAPAGQVSYAETPTYYAGVLYNLDGNLYDATTDTLIHTLSGVSGYYPQVTADANDVYYLTSIYQDSTYWVYVTGFDRTTYASTTSDLLATNQSAYGGFTRWGRYGFAYLNSNTSIEIARSTIIPDMP